MTFEKIHKRAVSEWEALQSSNKPRLLVGAGTCGSAAGALDVLKAINEELARQSIEAIVIQVGCMGLCFAEKDGTFTNTERRIQRVRKAIEPIGNSKPDWWIICQLAMIMGAQNFDFEHPSEVMDEIAMLTPSYGGVTYERLEECGLQWPCPTKDHPGTSILHVGRFVCGLGRFMPLQYRPPAELPDKEYPLILTTGRSLYHYHTGTMTRKVTGLNTIEPEGVVEINPSDASSLKIKDGDKVKVISHRGDVIVKARLTEKSPPKVVYMTFHFAESAANILTNTALDPVAKIPEFKVCAVRIERVKGK